MDVTYKGPDGRLYRVSNQPDAKGGYYIEYRDPAGSAVYKPLPGYHHNANRDNVVTQLADLAKGRGLVVARDKPATTAKPKGTGVWLYGEHRAMRVGIGNDTDRSDCRYYHVLTINLLADKPQWRKLSGAGNYDHRHLADAAEELRETLPEDARELTEAEAEQLFTNSSTGWFDLKPNAVKVWDKIMADTAAAPEIVDESSEPDTPHAPEPAAIAVPPAADIAAPGFDYDGLDAQTVTMLHGLEDKAREEYARHYVYLAGIVAQAHEILCPPLSERSDNGKFTVKDDTFRRWCEYIGVSKSTAYQLLQVEYLLDHTESKERAILERQPIALLYAAAKPSAPAELVEAVKAGDITTHKQYKELEAQLKATETAKVEAERKVKGLQTSYNTAHANEMYNIDLRKKAEEEATEARRALNAALDQQGDYIAKIRELEKRPREVDVAVQKPSEAEIEQWRREGEERARASMAGQAPTASTLNDCLPMSRDMAKNIRTTQKLFFIAVSALSTEEKARCIEPLLDAVNELSALLSATLNDTNFEEEASPFD